MEQRQHIRSSIIGMTAYISDQAGICRGTLRDISRFGLCITDIPREIHTKNGFFSVMINGRGQNFELQLKEKWKQENGMAIMVGAGIDEAPWDWVEMTIRHELRHRHTLYKS